MNLEIRTDTKGKMVEWEKPGKINNRMENAEVLPRWCRRCSTGWARRATIGHFIFENST